MLMLPQDYLVYYKGPFDDVILARISDFLRNKFPESPKICHTLFAIFVEFAQNISRYSSEHNHFGSYEDSHGVGMLGIYRSGEYYVLKASNLVERSKAEALLDRCKTINGLDYDGLRTLKKEMRSMPRISDRSGGNIGLIQVAMRSGQPLNVELHPHEDEQFVYLTLSSKVPQDAAAFEHA